MQIKQRLKQEYENELKEKEYDKIMKEHQKEMDELDRKKQEEIKKQVLREKESRDEQMRQNYIRKRIEILKEKKFEKNLVKNIKEGIEKEKQKAIEKKKKENEALLRAIKENDNNNNSNTKEPFAKITEVSDNSPAFESGLKVNDFIIKFDNFSVILSFTINIGIFLLLFFEGIV